MLFRRSAYLEAYNKPPKEFEGQLIDAQAYRVYLANHFIVDAYSATHNAVPFIHDGESNVLEHELLVEREGRLVLQQVETLLGMNPEYTGPSEMRYIARNIEGCR